MRATGRRVLRRRDVAVADEPSGAAAAPLRRRGRESSRTREDDTTHLFGETTPPHADPATPQPEDGASVGASRAPGVAHTRVAQRASSASTRHESPPPRHPRGMPDVPASLGLPSSLLTLLAVAV